MFHYKNVSQNEEHRFSSLYSLKTTKLQVRKSNGSLRCPSWIFDIQYGIITQEGSLITQDMTEIYMQASTEVSPKKKNAFCVSGHWAVSFVTRSCCNSIVRGGFFTYYNYLFLYFKEACKLLKMLTSRKSYNLCL